MIKSARKRQNLTQKELALRCNMSQGYLSKLERKIHSNVRIEHIIAIAKALSINHFDLAKWFINNHLEFSTKRGYSL